MDETGKAIAAVLTLDPVEAIRVAAQRPGSVYEGERLQRLLQSLAP